MRGKHGFLNDIFQLKSRGRRDETPAKSFFDLLKVKPGTMSK
ncbi:hypothetical protein NNO_0780 [Hydrogenimonas sp.]|nr:hypothetical protein NNO_0780 [Hydrogenimonas sp.]